MTWTTPVPAAVSAARDMIVACAASSTFGLTSGQFHYPNAAMSGASPDSRPLCVLAEVTHDRTRYAEAGVLGNPSGTITATIYGDTATSSISTMENLARDICSQLLTQSTGLPLRSVTAALASDPTTAARAADQTTADNTAEARAITVTIQWGLNA